MQNFKAATGWFLLPRLQTQTLVEMLCSCWFDPAASSLIWPHVSNKRWKDVWGGGAGSEYRLLRVLISVSGREDQSLICTKFVILVPSLSLFYSLGREDLKFRLWSGLPHLVGEFLALKGARLLVITESVWLNDLYLWTKCFQLRCLKW